MSVEMVSLFLFLPILQAVEACTPGVWFRGISKHPLPLASDIFKNLTLWYMVKEREAFVIWQMEQPDSVRLGCSGWPQAGSQLRGAFLGRKGFVWRIGYSYCGEN